jgi:hypothetical protein
LIGPGNGNGLSLEIRKRPPLDWQWSSRNISRASSYCMMSLHDVIA